MTEAESAKTTTSSDASQPSAPTQQTVAYELPADHKGTIVYVRGWLNQDSLYPPVILLHDLGESTSRYRDLTKQLVDYGFEVYLPDLRGHGRSGRMLGHVERFGLLASDLLQVVSWAKHKAGGVSPILVSHGFSSLVLTNFQQRYPNYVDHVVFVSPMFALRRRINALRKFFFRLLSDLTPRIKLPARSTLSFSANSEPGFKLTTRFAGEISDALMSGYSKFLRLKSHTLLVTPERYTMADYGQLEAVISRHRNRSQIDWRKDAIKDEKHDNLAFEDLNEFSVVFKEWLDKKGLAGVRQKRDSD